MIDALRYGLFQTGLGIYLVTLFGASLLGWLQLARRRQHPAWLRPSVLAFMALIIVPSLLQIYAWPDLLPSLQRDATAIIQQHEWWRLLTAVMVQGGAFGGAVFNIICLLLLAPITTKLYGFKATVTVFLTGVIGGEIAGLFVLPVGAGNSVGNFGMASLLLLMTLSHGTKLEKWLAAIISVAGLGSLSYLDIHGFALLSGFIVSGALAYAKIVTWPARTAASRTALSRLK